MRHIICIILLCYVPIFSLGGEVESQLKLQEQVICYLKQEMAFLREEKESEEV